MTDLVASPFMGDGRLTVVGDKPRRYHRHSRFSPTKVGAQFLRHQLRVKTRSMKFRVLHHQLWAKARSMERKFLAFRTHSIYLAKNLCFSEGEPSGKPIAIRHSLIAIRCLSDLPITKLTICRKLDSAGAKPSFSCRLQKGFGGGFNGAITSTVNPSTGTPGCGVSFPSLSLALSQTR